MTTKYPGALDDTATMPVVADNTDDVLATHHNNQSDALIAVETKVGTGASTPASGHVLKGNGSGTSAWGALEVADLPDLSSTYAPIAKGVTNGDSHNHDGGDGAQIAYSSLSGTPTVPVKASGAEIDTGIDDAKFATAKAIEDSNLARTTNKLSAFAATTSAELAGVISDETGSGKLVFDTSPTLVTPTLGVATATSINKVALTAPATGSTLTIADGKTLTVSNDATISGTNTGDQTVPVKATGVEVDAGVDDAKFVTAKAIEDSSYVKSTGNIATASNIANNTGTTTTVLHGNAAGAPAFGAVVEVDLSLSDNTTGNVSTSKHGFAPKLSNVAGQFLDGTGNWSAPAGGGDVLGPASNTANYLPQWNGANSKTLKDGVAIPTGGLAGLTSPSFTTPTLGVASATSINKVAITAPATSATITVADGKTLTVSNDATVSGTNTGDQTLPVKASGAEINTGSDDAKFATAKAINDSHNVPSVTPSTSGNIMTSDGTDWTSAAPLTVAWTDVSTFSNSWVNYGSPAPNAGYSRDLMGTVILRGGLKSGTIGQAAFTLPVGSRPSGSLFFNVFCWNGSGQALARVTIASDGTVTPDLGNNAHISLDGIAFRL